jgi:hypothetical protein
MMIVIDPYMIAVPTGEEVNAQTVREYARRLKKWEREFSDRRKFIVSEGASQAIRKQGLEPTRTRLTALFKRFNIVDYSPNDIVPTTSGVLVNSPRVEEVAGLYDSDILLDIEYVRDTEVVIPDEIRARLHPEVAAEFIQSLIYAGYAREVHKDTTVWSLATAPLKQGSPRSEMLLECTIEKLGNGSIITQEAFSQEWPLLFDPEHLYATYDILEFYQSNPHLATRIAWCKMKAEGTRLQGIDSVQLAFGDRFMESLNRPRMQRRPHFEQDIDKIFRAIVYVLEDLWPYPSDKHHPLRQVINDRTSRQQTRQREDSSGKRCLEKAARVEVTAGANCLHLHYWQCFHGGYEFSNVTDDHDDPTIHKGY